VAELLIEIGFEEMPAPWLPGLAEQLRTRFVDAAAREFLGAKDTAVAWTPRRLVLRADLPARQADREEPVWGPALKVAKDASGAWTAAAQGFAKKNGVAVEALLQKPKDEAKSGELNLLFVKKVAGRATGELVPGLLSLVLRALAFPKRMSWDAWLEDGRGAFPFGRPIRWLVLVFDNKVVPFSIYALEAGAKGARIVESGSTTRGHRFLPKGRGLERPAVSSYSELRDALGERFVLLDPGERTNRIADGMQEASKGAIFDRGLLDEWRDLVEYPTVLEGRVPEEFRALPSEVLETVLVHHQKYFSLRDAQGRIDRFAAVTNGAGAAESEIVRGMERVVVARLRDASFFLTEDRKRPLSERVADLAGVTFHRGLGTYKDKSARMVVLIEAMGRRGLLAGEAFGAAKEAARLAKADLVTLMVREFPELQGVMGGIYLEYEGAREEVAAAVRWHYHPIAVEPTAEPEEAFVGKDDSARVFAAVSLADKLDTLAGYFTLGENPTGSRDPYGLRRAAHGVVRLLLDFWRAKPGELRPNLTELVMDAVSGFAGPSREQATTSSNVLELFLLDRLTYVLEARGYPVDEVAAAINTNPNAGPYALDDPMDCMVRLSALHRVRAEFKHDFEQLAIAFKRAKNILDKEPGVGFYSEEGLVEEAEIALSRAIEASRRAWNSESREQQAYETRLRSVAALVQPVDRFFTEVLVLADEESLKRNRLGLLDYLIGPIYRIADISRLGGTS
jgi:glycyl-tRNA synthetase beta chain